MIENKITPHESIQLHELLSFKNLCLTKSVTVAPLVNDEELKTIIKNDVSTTTKHVMELRDLMQNSDIATSIFTATYS